MDAAFRHDGDFGFPRLELGKIARGAGPALCQQPALPPVNAAPEKSACGEFRSGTYRMRIRFASTANGIAGVCTEDSMRVQRPAKTDKSCCEINYLICRKFYERHTGANKQQEHITRFHPIGRYN